MGINRIRLQDGAVVDPRVDARMQQTYQQNIAANQAQQARNEGIFQAAKDKLQGFGNTLTGVVEGARDYTIPVVQGARALLTGAGEPIITDSMRRDLIERAEAKGGDSGFLGYEDYGLTPAGNVSGGRFGGGITDIISDPQAFANAATLGRVTYKKDPVTGEYTFGDTKYDFNIGDEDTGIGSNLLRGINEGGLRTAIPNVTEDLVQGAKDLFSPTTAAAAEATPTGDAGGIITDGDIKYRINADGSRTPIGIHGERTPDTSSLIGPENLKNFPGATDRIEVWNPINKSWTSIGRDSPENRANAASMRADIAAKLGGEQGRKYLEQYDRNEASMYQGGRVGFQAGSTEEMIKAQEAAAQDPELDRIRQQLFGEGYVQDIGEGRGIAQYYSGFGLPQSLAFTPAPVEEVAPVADVIEPVVETGGGGGGTGDVDITTPDVGDAPINLDTPLTQMITTPTGDTMTVKEAFTQPEAYDIPGEMPKTPVSGAFGPFEYLQPETSDPFLMSGAAGGARLPQIGYGEGEVDPGLAQAAGLTTGYPEAAQQDPTFWENARDKFIETGQDIGNVFTNLKDQGIDIAKMAGSAIMNAIAPGLGFVMQALPEDSIENKTTRGVVDELKAENDYGYNMSSGTLNQDPFGRNPISAFGDYEQTLMDDLNYVGDNKFNNAKKDFAQDYFNKKSEFAGGVEVDEGTVLGPGEAPGDLVTAEDLAAEKRKEGLEELSDIYSGIGQTRDAPSPTPQEIPDRGRGDGRDTGPTESPQGSGDPYGGGEGGVQSGLGSPDVGEVSSDAGFSEPSNQGGGGGGGGGGKIVCTMMNDSYGFGSFRNKIWLRQSKNLAPEYQIGYHKIFLPLVRLSKTNKLLKKTLEHIAVHRTIDIRQEARGKVHLLGRVYRKVLEPICYWVGKHAKR